ILTDNSRLLYGTRGRPANLRRHLQTIAGAFRNRNTRPALPYSIRGLWKADLFFGYSGLDKDWLGTTVKINTGQLEASAGLRIGIVPTKQGRSDSVRKDDSKNLVICPLPHDQDFMQIFLRGMAYRAGFHWCRCKSTKRDRFTSPRRSRGGSYSQNVASFRFWT